MNLVDEDDTPVGGTSELVLGVDEYQAVLGGDLLTTDKCMTYEHYHEVKRGTADRSYGVQVARLAGLPQVVVERAKVVLDALEKGEREGGGSRKAVIDDLPLFSATPAPAPVKPKDSEVEDRLKTVLPDELTPKEALALIYELRDLL